MGHGAPIVSTFFLLLFITFVFFGLFINHKKSEQKEKDTELETKGKERHPDLVYA